MRIIKYLFLLLLLSLVALSIFVATQKGEFLVEKSKIINSPKATVFNYVNDFTNWEDFNSWMIEDSEMKINFPQNTTGKGGSYSWVGKDGNGGSIETVFVKENDSISQKMNYNGTNSHISWSFKDTLGGTKVTWRTKGKMNFISKIYSTFNDSFIKDIEKKYTESLDNLDKKLDYEINTYSIKVDGLIQKTGAFYLKQTFTSEISKITKNSKIVFPKILAFCKNNNLTIQGKPFIIYHSYDKTNKLSKLSICVPIKEEIYTSPGSDILSGKFDSFQAVKTTLNGDYSHREKALDKTKQYLNANHLSPDTLFSYLEIYSISETEIINPSKWVTEIYVPIKSKGIIEKPKTVSPIIKEIVAPTIEKENESEF